MSENYVLLYRGKDSSRQHSQYSLIIVKEIDGCNYEIEACENDYIEIPYNNFSLKADSIYDYFGRHGMPENILTLQNGLYGYATSYGNGGNEEFYPFKNQNLFRSILHNFLETNFLL